jgi:hypothetical protein
MQYFLEVAQVWPIQANQISAHCFWIVVENEPQSSGKPTVWTFPKLLICLDCGFTECVIPAVELRLLREDGGRLLHILCGRGHKRKLTSGTHELSARPHSLNCRQ